MERSEILSGIFTILLFGLMFNGCIHSCNKHKDDPVWLTNTPASIYRGAEFFWHDDFAGVDWDKRLRNDAFTMYVLMNKTNDGSKLETTTTEIEKFTKKINTYPADKKGFLKSAAKTYARYNLLACEDLITYLTALEDDEIEKPAEWEQASKSTKDSLVGVYGIEEVNTGKKMMDSLMFEFTVSSDTESFEKMKNLKSFMQAVKEKNALAVSRVYKMIFNEPLDAVEKGL